MADKQTQGLPDGVFNANLYKIVLSMPIKQVNSVQPHAAGTYTVRPYPPAITAVQHENRSYTRAEINRNGDKFQLSMYTAKQVFHSNFAANELKLVLDGLFGIRFQQYHAWDSEYEYSARISKKGKILTARKKSANRPRAALFNTGSFDRQKNHILKEGEPIPALVDMGVFTKEGKIITGMRDKFNQINRFLELLADETGPDLLPGSMLNGAVPETIANSSAKETTVNIVDFGCGKSYLTFLVYYYFAKMRGLSVNICGLDLDAHVVASCTAAAEKYGYKSLKFLQGDIGAQPAPPVEGWGSANTLNIVISLHACDTATDYALFNAIKWNADLIYAVPCCQHELRNQMTPQNLSLFTRHGIIKERIASLATDAIRANLLECCGYKSQIIEFVDMEHTPKNLLIRARRRVGKGNVNAAAWGEAEKVITEFGFAPTLLKLLNDGGYMHRYGI